MLIAVTKSQFQSILTNVSSATLLFYSKLLGGDIASVSIAFPVGWVTFSIVGAYSASDFNSDTANFTAMYATTISA